MYKYKYKYKARARARETGTGTWSPGMHIELGQPSKLGEPHTLMARTRTALKQ